MFCLFALCLCSFVCLRVWVVGWRVLSFFFLFRFVCSCFLWRSRSLAAALLLACLFVCFGCLVGCFLVCFVFSWFCLCLFGFCLFVCLLVCLLVFGAPGGLLVCLFLCLFVCCLFSCSNELSADVKCIVNTFATLPLQGSKFVGEERSPNQIVCCCVIFLW